MPKVDSFEYTIGDQPLTIPFPTGFSVDPTECNDVSITLPKFASDYILDVTSDTITIYATEVADDSG